MSNSFVEGYASRSDEKGFEGASGGKQSTTKVEKDKFIHENHPGLLFINMKKNKIMPPFPPSIIQLVWSELMDNDLICLIIKIQY